MVMYNSFYGNDYLKLMKTIYGVKRDHNRNLIGIRELLDIISLDQFNDSFSN